MANRCWFITFAYSVDIVSGSKVLTRDDRVRSNRRIQRIKAAQKAFRKEAPFRVMGVIEEMDQ
jgi:hypothetical protein